MLGAHVMLLDVVTVFVTVLATMVRWSQFLLLDNVDSCCHDDRRVTAICYVTACDGDARFTFSPTGGGGQVR